VRFADGVSPAEARVIESEIRQQMGFLEDASIALPLTPAALRNPK